MALYKQGFDLVFDEETEKALVEYRKQFTYLDEVESQIYEYLDMLVPNNWDKMSAVQQHQYTWAYFNNAVYRDEDGKEYERSSLQN